MSTLQVVGGDATIVMGGTAEVDAPLSRDRCVVAWIERAGSAFGGLCGCAPTTARRWGRSGAAG